MIKKLLEIAKINNIEMEIAINYEDNTCIETFNDTVEKYEVSNVKVYKIKALYQGKLVNITTEDITNPNILVDMIINNARVIDNFEDTTFAKKVDIKNNNKKIPKTDYNIIIKDLLDLDKFRKKYPNLESIKLTYTSNYNNLSIINDEVKLIDSNNLIYIYGEIIWKENNICQTGWFQIKTLKYDLDKIKEKLEETIIDASKKINAVSLKTGKYKVLLKNSEVFNLLKTFSDMFNSEEIKKKKSVLNDYFNKHVFSNKITIVEDPLNSKLIGKRIFDIEGNPTYYKEIVKDGVFITKLYDNKNAIIENTNPTGTSDGVRNMYILKGKSSYQELIKKMNNGVIIDSIEGLHAGVNKLTGEISLQATGYEVVNGNVGEALKLIIFQTNLIDLFNSVIDIGNDLEMFSIMGGSPSILFDNVMIIGKE